MDEATWWLLVGFGGQALFMGRSLLQWIASERARRSIVPVGFWHLSIAGALVLLGYAIHQRDPVFVAGQGLGVAIYLRNLRLIRNARDVTASEPARTPDPAAPGKTTPGADPHCRPGTGSAP